MAPTSPITLVVLFSVFTLVVLLVLRDRTGCPPVACGFGGSRNINARELRPHRKNSPSGGPTADRGFGLLLSERTFTVDLGALPDYRYHRSPLCTAPGARATIFLAVSAVIVMVGASRVYLGVHYATDVVSGISLGAAWALLLAGFFTLWLIVARPECSSWRSILKTAFTQRPASSQPCPLGSSSGSAG